MVKSLSNQLTMVKADFSFLTDAVELFNTRELSLIFWCSILLIWLISSENMRASLASVVMAFFCRQFVYVYFIALIYIGCCIVFLNKMGIWDKTLVKDTIMWTIFVAWPLMFKASKITSFQEFIKEIIKPLIAFSILFEYIFGLYTFRWWIEFLTVPLMVMIGGMIAVSERNPEYQKVHKLLNGTVTFLGLTSLIFICIHLFQYYEQYTNRLVLMQFLMPLFLSLLFLPLLYGLAMYVHYESTFQVLERHFRHRSMYRYALFMAMIRFNADLEGMLRWKQMVLSKNLKSKAELDNAVNLIKTLQRSERKPYTVNEGLGWSPYQVKDLLDTKGITTSDYKNTIDDEFSAISFPVKLYGSSVFSDTITLMVIGKQLFATKLDLGLKVFDGSIDDSTSTQELLNCAETLYQGVYEEILPREIKTAILEGQNYSFIKANARLLVKKNLWQNQMEGYSIDFKIIHNNHID
ncbi:hypothetical protein [Pedobacter nyackensis]|uniref:hypothetical protein n=1 Tax=Pedobacter nyackensis TaxID=475255 RepID=UPI00292E4169|nr:hypothetical protein [Pedobacter nyackensis]